jgi:hypothetical protein
MIWGYLLHVGYNFWGDRDITEWSFDPDHFCGAKPYLRFDESLYDDLLPRMKAAGINLVVLDLGDAIRWESHPEIAVEGAWSVTRLREELARMRGMGMEPIPKLNFSTAHDQWLGPYSRMVSTPTYYQVVADLIAEVCTLFDTPRFFHLGMDEETYGHQRHYRYAVVRQYDLWWHDLNWYIEQTERGGSRPWVWSDYVWHHPETFIERMPRTVLQSNWYYDAGFPDAGTPGAPEGVHGNLAYPFLEANGYDQIPTGSNWTSPENFGGTVAYARRTIAPERLKGFLQTVWKPTLEIVRDRHLAAIEQVARARDAFG